MIKRALIAALSAPALFVLAPPAGMGQAVPGDAVNVCAREGELAVLCSLRRWEDLVLVPGTDWVVASSINDGGLHLIHARRKADIALYPSPSARQQPDTATYGTCPHPPAPQARVAFSGVAVRPASARGTYTVYAVRANPYRPNIGPDRVGVEVFRLDLRGHEPTVTWTGCILPPDVGVGLNSIAPLTGGGFLATNFNGGEGVTREKVAAGQHLGQIWEWEPAAGWTRLEDTEVAGPNGIVASPDGKVIFVSAWGAHNLIRIDRRTTPATRTVIPLGIRVDNLHWQADSKILGAAQHDEGAASVVEIDPKTMKVRTLFQKPNTDAFQHFTSAARVGNEIWIAASRAEGLGIIPAPR